MFFTFKNIARRLFGALTIATPIIFGLQIELTSHGDIALSPDPYIEEFPIVNLDARIDGGEIANPSGGRSTFRRRI